MTDPSNGRDEESCPAGTSTPQALYLASLKSFHTEVAIASRLFEDGHYDEAVRKASQRFVNRVQELADRPDLDGVALMNKSFSDKSPLLEFNDRETLIERDEHNGYRFLTVGLTQAVRNVVTHHDNYGLGPVSAFEWLAFISAMHRRLDQAQQIPQQAPIRLSMPGDPIEAILGR